MSTATDPGAPRVAAIILNYRTPDLTVDCLATLAPERADCPGLSAVVVDNASDDGSAEAVAGAIERRGWSGWARLVRAAENRGFAAGNNLGIASAEADFYWLLNSDTLVRRGATAELLRAAAARPEFGLYSPRLEWPDGAPQVSCFRFLRPPTEAVRSAAVGALTRLLRRYEPALPLPDGPIEPGWTSFASVLIRRAVLATVGPLDEGYFMYYEDVDYCRRARAAGFRVLHWPAARVVHLRGRSGTVKRDTAERRPRPTYFYAARARYYAKFHGRAGLWVANLWWLAGRAVGLVRAAVGPRRQSPVCRREARDIWTNWLRPLRPEGRHP
jgi:N-acetylglucosaminyl-diphospho-decaprenol L-rhamnosyltransferase